MRKSIGFMDLADVTAAQQLMDLQRKTDWTRLLDHRVGAGGVVGGEAGPVDRDLECAVGHGVESIETPTNERGFATA
ncbi:MAG: hypothetical protein WD069_19100 [Planctomycetales bacterium]